MGPAQELLSFVLRSANRVATLRALSPDPASRADLQAETDIPRATLSRILADCADRDLVERTGHAYALTPLGAGLLDGLDGLFATTDRLQALADGLPLDDLDVDLFTVEDVSVTLANRIDPTAPIGRAADAVESADEVRGFCYSLLHAPILAMTRDIVETGGRFEGVVAAEVLRVVAADADLIAPVRALLETGQAELSVYDGAIGTQFIIVDDRVLFLVGDDEGAIRGLVETGAPAIRPWAEARFEAHRAEAERLDPDAVTDLLTA